MVVPNLSLEGKVALVSGSRRGIGQAIALRFGEAGANVAVCDYVAGKELDATMGEIKKAGRRSLAQQLDVRDKVSVSNVVQKVESELGGIDILVNAAGVLRVIPAIKLSEEDWDTVLDTNLKGMFLMCQAVAKGMITRKRGGCIINIASTDAFNPIPNQLAYNCSKAGVRMLTNTLGFEFGRYGIRVCAIAPGATHTAMMASYGLDDSEVVGEIGLGRFAEPIDQANAALFLASDLASYISGDTLRVDGCMCMGSVALYPEEVVSQE